MADNVEREVLQLVADTKQYFEGLDGAIAKHGALNTSIGKTGAAAKTTSADWKQFGEALNSTTAPLASVQVGLNAVPGGFTNLSRAAQGAYVDLKQIDTLVRQFSGTDAKRRAEELAGAVQKIGGASKLTATEAGTVNRELKSWIEKARQMGAEVPKHLLDLERATRQTAAGFTNVGNKAQGAYVDLQRVNQLVNQFSGNDARRRAEELAAAIQKVGGAARLTAAEKQRANQELQAWIDKARFAGEQVPKHIQQLANATATSSAGMTSRIKEVALGYIAGAATMQTFLTVGRKVTEFLQESIQEFLDAEKTQRQLTAALEQQGTALPSVLSYYDALATKHKNLSVNSADAIRQTELLLVQVGGVLPSEMDKGLKAVTNLAAGLSIDLPAAAKMVATSFEDSFGGLKKAGVQIDDARAKAEGMDYVLEQINKKFGGQAQAELDTYAGKVQQLENNWAELKEELGRTLVETGALKTGLAGLEIGVALLGVALREQLAFMRTAPSFSDFFTNVAGPAGAVVDWYGRANDELVRMTNQMRQARAEAEGLKNAAPGVVRVGMFGQSGPAVNIEAQIRERRRLEEEKNRAAKAAEEASKRATAAAHQAEEQYQAWKRSVTGLSDEHRKMLNWMLRLSAEGGPKLVGSLLPVKDVTDDLTKHTAIQGKALVKMAEDAKNAMYAVLGLQRVQQSFALIRPIDPNVLFRNALTPAQLLKGVRTPDIVDAERKLARLNTGFSATSQLIRTVGQSSTGTFRSVISWVDGATSSVFEYISAIKAATTASQTMAAASNLALAGATMGISFIVGGLFQMGAEAEESRRRAAAFRKEIEDLGFTVKEFRDLERSLLPTDTSALARFAKGGTQQTRDFIKTTFEEIDQALAKAQTRLEHFGGKAPQALQPFIAELLKAKHLTDEQRKALEGMAGAPHWKDLQSRAEDLGIELTALGPSFSAARIKDIAFGYVRDLTMFQEAGADTDGVLRGMQDELVKLAKESSATFTPLPKQLQPAIDRLREMGLLVDENGNLIEGFSFKDMEDESLSAVKDVLEEIRDLLSRLLPEAADKAATGIRRAFSRVAPAELLPGFESPALQSSVVDRGWNPRTSTIQFPREIVVKSYIEGREAARGVAPFLTDEVDYMGLARG